MASNTIQDFVNDGKINNYDLSNGAIDKVIDYLKNKKKMNEKQVHYVKCLIDLSLSHLDMISENIIVNNDYFDINLAEYDDEMILWQKSGRYWNLGSFMLNCRIKKGQWYYEIEILYISSSSISSISSLGWKLFGSSYEIWIYYSDGTKYADYKKQNYGNKWSVGDII